MFTKLFKSDTFSVNLYCPQCLSVLEGCKCDLCDKLWCKKTLYKNQNFFISVPLVSQFKHILQTLNLGKDLNYRNTRKRNPNSVDDIFDGKLYKNICERSNLKNDYSFSLTFNSDGVPVFKSSSFSIWPILTFINEFPPEYRKKHMLLAGLWFGSSKPTVTSFFKPFVDEMKKLSCNGFEWLLNGEKIVSYVYCLVCSCDSVARAMLQNIKQFNGKYGCNWCLHPGTRVEKGKGSVQVYSADGNYSKRNHQDMISHARTSHRKNTEVYGVKGPSAFMLIPHFDLVQGFIVDYMHCIDLGILRQLASLWLDSLNHEAPWYVGTKIDDIDSKLTKMHPPSNITRTPRSLKLRAYWKASEWRAFLHFYGPLVLKSVLPNKYYQHMLLLNNAIYMLLKESVSQLELFHVSAYLNQFVQDFEKLYGQCNMTFNVHLLLHITDSVRNWGPLWCCSAYSFESYNGTLLKLFHGTQAVPQQIASSFLLLQHIEQLAQDTIGNAHEVVKCYFSELLDGYSDVKRAIRLPGIVLFGTGRVGNMNVYEKFGVEQLLGTSVDAQAVFYNKAYVNGQVYQSINYLRSQKRNNTIVQVKKQGPVQIQSFAKIVTNGGQEHVLCIVCPITLCKNKYIGTKCVSTGSTIKHITFIDCINKLDVKAVKVEHLCGKHVFYDDGREKIICLLPNNFERD